MTDSPLDRLRQAADEALGLFAQAVVHEAAQRPREAAGARERGGRLLHQAFSRWFQRHYRRLGLSEDAAEDLTQDAFVKLYLQAHTHGVRGNAFALVCTVRRSVFLDHLKRHRAAMRGGADAAPGGAEVLLSDEEWLALADGQGDGTGEHGLAGLVDCVQRKLVAYQREAPARAEVLELLCFGLSAREIAAVVYAKPEPEVTPQEAANMRDRIYNTRNQARALFAECREDAP
jgi:DNA-directed RNA polymerase specialized sigma24 family protein